MLGIAIDVILQHPAVYEVEASTEKVEPREVRLEVVIDWTEDRIKQEIKDTFPEYPDVAVAIATCESHLRMVQSNHVQPYGREESFGIFQIHARDHEQTAKRLGLEDYKTDIQENIQMARYLYEQRGNFTDWSCYNNGDYKKYL